MSVTVRTARDADMPVLGVLGAALIALHRDLDPERFFATSPRTVDAYSAYLGRQARGGDAIVLVADDAGAVVGYAYGELQGTDYMALRGPAGVLHDLIVDPSRRQGGIGRRLLDAMVDAFVARGVPRFVLSTAARNEAAQRLFAKAGLRPTMIEMTRELPRTD